MITREEIVVDGYDSCTKEELLGIIKSNAEYFRAKIKSLEAKLSNTELSCDGCKWQKYPDQIFDQINGCEICSRYKENYDRYQTKDTQ